MEIAQVPAGDRLEAGIRPLPQQVERQLVAIACGVEAPLLGVEHGEVGGEDGLEPDVAQLAEELERTFVAPLGLFVVPDVVIQCAEVADEDGAGALVGVLQRALVAGARPIDVAACVVHAAELLEAAGRLEVGLGAVEIGQQITREAARLEVARVGLGFREQPLERLGVHRERSSCRRHWTEQQRGIEGGARRRCALDHRDEIAVGAQQPRVHLAARFEVIHELATALVAMRGVAFDGVRREVLHGVLAHHGEQLKDARAQDPHQLACGELAHVLYRVGAHDGLGVVDVEGAPEHGAVGQGAPLCRRQQLPRPIDGGIHVGDLAAQMIGAEQAKLSRGERDREGEPFDRMHDVSHRPVLLSGWIVEAGHVHQHGAGIRRRERLQRQHVLLLCANGGATGHHPARVGGDLAQAMQHVVGHATEVLVVVEGDHGGITTREHAADGLGAVAHGAHPEAGGDGGHELLRAARRRQVAERSIELLREARLTDPGCSPDGDERVLGDRLSRLFELALPSEKHGWTRRQPSSSSSMVAIGR